MALAPAPLWNRSASVGEVRGVGRPVPVLCCCVADVSGLREGEVRHVPATAHIIGSHHELRGIPGAMTEYQSGPTTTSYDVCCPGCGTEVYHLNGVSYPMSGTCNGTVSLTCSKAVRFRPCCGSSWHLTEGVWIEADSGYYVPPSLSGHTTGEPA
jgi:hypothetical protein